MVWVSHDTSAAAKVLRDGGLVAFATETVYGLGADATDDSAVARIFEAKGRPQFNPLIVHVPSLADARQLGQFNSVALQLAEAFWPGALTLVVPRLSNCPISLLVSAGLDSIAIRVPGHTGARELLRAAGVPVAAPSANPSGRISPTRVSHVVEGLGDRVDLILDGGECEVGLESTVIDYTGETPVVLRPGGVTPEDIRSATGLDVGLDVQATTAPVSPGQLASHYAPKATVRLNAHEIGADEALLAFGRSVPQMGKAVRNLSPQGDLVEAAGNLFAFLHELDATGAETIAVMPVPEKGLGIAINDRLQRAAADRG